MSSNFRFHIKQDGIGHQAAFGTENLYSFGYT